MRRFPSAVRSAWSQPWCQKFDAARRMLFLGPLDEFRAVFRHAGADDAEGDLDVSRLGEIGDLRPLLVDLAAGGAEVVEFDDDLRWRLATVGIGGDFLLECLEPGGIETVGMGLAWPFSIFGAGSSLSSSHLEIVEVQRTDRLLSGGRRHAG